MASPGEQRSETQTGLGSLRAGGQQTIQEAHNIRAHEVQSPRKKNRDSSQSPESGRDILCHHTFTPCSNECNSWDYNKNKQDPEARGGRKHSFSKPTMPVLPPATAWRLTSRGNEAFRWQRLSNKEWRSPCPNYILTGSKSQRTVFKTNKGRERLLNM